MGAKINENRGCVADAFLERFGWHLSTKHPNSVIRFGPFGDHFRPKIGKGRPKRRQKNDAEKG